VSKDKDQPKTGTGNKHGKPYKRRADVKKQVKDALKPPAADGKHRKKEE
jgi:hypothetical protein